MINERVRTSGGAAGTAGLLAALAILGALAAPATGQKPGITEDATAPLRRFPVSLQVQRAGLSGEHVSLLRLESLRPKDDLSLMVDPEVAKDWTFAEATVSSGQRINVRTWDLWDKHFRKKPVEIGKVPDGDIVPLYFLILNKRHEKRVADALHHALETSSEQIISQTASFQSIYQQQNRLLNFLSAYASLGPKQGCDPTYLKQRVALIDADLGIAYDPNGPQTQPGDLQHGLDASVGILTALRQSPDDPLPLAAIARQNLPAVVSDWVSLVGDLVHIFIKPPRQVKLTFVPASATEVDPSVTISGGNRDEWMQFTTERVLDSSPDSLPVLVYRPSYVRVGAAKPEQFAFAEDHVLAGEQDVSVPLSHACDDLYLHPWAWDWEISRDGQIFSPLTGGRLVPGRGLVFPASEGWADGVGSHKIYVRARIGVDVAPPTEITIAKAFPQRWAIDQQALPDLAAGDASATLRMTRAGSEQPFYRFAAGSLTDSAGKVIPADGVTYDGCLVARFNLTNAAPGMAQFRVQQENMSAADAPVPVFIAPKRPSIEVVYGLGDKVLRVTGADAGWVKSVQIPPLAIQEADGSTPNDRRMTLSGPLPPSVNSVEVTYRDPQRGLEWTRNVPLAVGLPRPQVQLSLAGSMPTTVSDGSGADPSWATADLPGGWFSTKTPIRVQLTASGPFNWTHDVTADLGLGSAGDVQPVASLQEGPAFALDTASRDAYVTLNLDTFLPPTAKRSSGVVWLRLTRSELSSAWIPVTLNQAAGGLPIRAVKLPVVQSVTHDAAGTHVTLANADDVLGVKFMGQTAFGAPTLVQSAPNVLAATVDGPVGATEFDIQLRDAGEGTVHVKIIRNP